MNKFSEKDWKIFRNRICSPVEQKMKSAGIPRMINRICEKTLMYAYQQQKRLIDEHMVRFVADHEMVGGIE